MPKIIVLTDNEKEYLHHKLQQIRFTKNMQTSQLIKSIILKLEE